MLNIGKLLFLSILAIALGVFLGAVPLGDGQTAAEHGEAWFEAGSPPQGKASRARRIESRPRATQRQATTSSVPPMPVALAQPAAPITAGAANTPEQTSASDKAALEALISRRATVR